MRFTCLRLNVFESGSAVRLLQVPKRRCLGGSSGTSLRYLERKTIERFAMKKLHLAVLPVAALTLLLAGCGSSAKTTDAPTDAATATAQTQSSAAFGKVIDLGGGVSITVADPASFKPTAFASNYFANQVHNKLAVTIQNGGASDLDLSTVLITAASGTNSCVDVLDGDSGINGAPTDPVAPKASANFTYGVGCDGKVGDPLTLTITLGTDTATVTGALV